MPFAYFHRVIHSLNARKGIINTESTALSTKVIHSLWKTFYVYNESDGPAGGRLTEEE